MPPAQTARGHDRQQRNILQTRLPLVRVPGVFLDGRTSRLKPRDDGCLNELLVEKGVITREVFTQKISEGTGDVSKTFKSYSTMTIREILIWKVPILFRSLTTMKLVFAGGLRRYEKTDNSRTH